MPILCKKSGYFLQNCGYSPGKNSGQPVPTGSALLKGPLANKKSECIMGVGCRGPTSKKKVLKHKGGAVDKDVFYGSLGYVYLG